MEKGAHGQSILGYQASRPLSRSTGAAGGLLVFWSVVIAILALGTGILAVVMAVSALYAETWTTALGWLLFILLFAGVSIKWFHSGIAILKIGLQFMRGEALLSQSAQHTILAMEAIAYTFSVIPALIFISLWEPILLLLVIAILLIGGLLTITRKLIESAMAFAAASYPLPPAASPASPAPAPPPPA